MLTSHPPDPKPATSSTSSADVLPLRLWTYAEVALTMRVQKQTVYEWVKRGMIPSPTYVGSTARFTNDQVRAIMTGVRIPGTYTVAKSARAAIGKLAAAAKKKKKTARAAASAKKPVRPSRKGK